MILTIWYRLNAIMCKLKGHDWEDGYDIGPESIREWCECKQCGLCFSSE